MCLEIPSTFPTILKIGVSFFAGCCRSLIRLCSLPSNRCKILSPASAATIPVSVRSIREAALAEPAVHLSEDADDGAERVE